MKCFYHNDMDGKCAAFWVYLNELKNRPCTAAYIKRLFESNPAGTIDEYTQMIPIDYKDRFPLESIYPSEDVWIVDYSISPDRMAQLLAITPNVVWIDHHKTAIEKYQDFGHEVKGVRHDGIAGCELTWIYIHLMINRKTGVQKQPFDPAMRESVPAFTQLIGDRDTWQWQYGDNTRQFYAGLELHDTSPWSNTWMEARKRLWRFGLDGVIVEKYKKVQRQEQIKALAFWTEFEGYRCIAANVGRTSSELFESVSQPYDIMMPFYFDGSQWTISLYSETVDVSEIAKKYGGGGHKGASGFQCKSLPFEKKEGFGA